MRKKRKKSTIEEFRLFVNGKWNGKFLVKVAEIVKGRTEVLERETRSHLSVLFTLKSVSSFSTSTGHSTGQECHKIMVSTCDSLMSSASNTKACITPSGHLHSSSVLLMFLLKLSRCDIYEFQ